MARDEAYRKAEENIEETLRSGSKKLDLSTKPWVDGATKLSELPESLGRLTQLQELNLSGNRLTMLPEWLGQLTQLQSLDISMNPLTALPTWLGQFTQLQSLNLYRSQLTALPEWLDQLTQLQSLELSGNQLATLPEWLDRFTQLQSLDLSHNPLRALPESVGRLTQLQTLFLIGSQLPVLPEWLGRLKQLHSLNLSRNLLTALPESLGQLSQLQSLNLSNNQLAALPDSMGQLTQLQSLDLSRNQLTALPDSMGELTQLQSLDLSRNQLTALPESLGRLKQLQSLDLSSNELKTLPEWMGWLRQLQSLDLANNRLTALPEWLGQLAQLQSLNLSGNRLATLPDWLDQLAQLETLFLTGNRLTALPERLGRLKQLQSLNLSSNRLTTLPESLGQLSQLRLLHLSDNQLKALPESLGQLEKLLILTIENNVLRELPEGLQKLLNLGEFTLHGNDGLSIPKELLGPTYLKSRSNNPPAKPQDILSYYFAQRSGPRRALNEVKVLVVGESEVGKTSLIRQLRGEDYNPKEDKTHGIERHRSKMCCGRMGEVRLNIWDFGGQDIMHATHQFFLTHRSVYLLVLDSRQNERQSRIDYWLRLIASYGGDSPVIVVCNKADQQVMQLNWSGLQREYPQITGFAREVSCYHHTGEDRRKGLDDLKRQIAEAVENRVAEVDKPILTSWLDLKDELEKDSRDYLTLKDYHELAESRGVKSQRDREILLTLMHRLGSVLHFSEHSIFDRDREKNAAPEHVEELNVLHPGWITGAIYKLLNDADLIRQGGQMDRGSMRRSLAGLPGARYPKSREDFIISMMRRFEICFAFDGEQDRWFLPDLLDKDEVDTGDWNGALNFRYQYRVLPGSIVGRLMVRLHNHIAKRCLWRTGAKLKQGSCEALVRSEPEESRIDVLIRGGSARERREFLALIRGTLSDIHRSFSENLGVKELVAVPGLPTSFVGYQKLLLLEEIGTTIDPEEVDGKLIAINVPDALNGVTEREYRDEERARLLRKEEKMLQAPIPHAPTPVQVVATVWWKSWPTISFITALVTGALALVLMKWENTTARIIIGIVAIVFVVMMTHNPLLRFRRWFQWSLFGWLGTNAAGITLAGAWKNEKGEAMLKWDGTVGWSFNAAFIVVIVVIGLLVFQEWKKEMRG